MKNVVFALCLATAAPGSLARADSPGVDLNAISVVQRFPQFKPEDSFNQTKIAEALGLVTAEMIVHTVPFESGNGVDYMYYPSPSSGESQPPEAVGDECKTGKGMSKYGAVVYKERSIGQLKLGRCNNISGVLEVDTPGVVWSLGGIAGYNNMAVFITLDGGRYGARTGKLAAGMPDPGAWPKPLHHQYLLPRDIAALAKIGAVPEADAAGLTAAENAWGTCYKAAWEKANAEYRDNDASHADWRTKDARSKQITARYEKSADTRCGPQYKKFESTTIAIHAAVAKQRAATYAGIRARLAKPAGAL